jgi:hypothetical protein
MKAAWWEQPTGSGSPVPPKAKFGKPRGKSGQRPRQQVSA